MNVARERAVAAALPNGEVLVAGGENETGQLKSAELYDPSSNKWTVAAPMHEEREGAAAAALPDGDVLVAGGLYEEEYEIGPTFTLASAEIYDPSTNTWTAVAPMNNARKGAVAATLGDGEVIVAGGNNGGGGFGSAEIYNPVTNEWRSALGLFEPGSDFAAAATLPDGKAILVGGKDFSSYEPFATTQIFDPLTETWREGTPAALGRVYEVAAGLPDGDVLVDSGHGEEHGPAGYLLSSEAYDPVTETWSADTPPLAAREGAVAATLPDGAVLVAGGEGPGGEEEYLTTAELFYSAPEVQAAGGGFATRAVGTQSPDQVVTVTNVGAEPLSITGATVTGADAGDFAITADTCPTRAIPLGQSCAITVRFTPVATGSRTATIALTDNEASPTAISLSGTGATAGSGTGGTSGATGATGPAGPSGTSAQLELITCTTTTHGHGSQKRTFQKCTARATRATLTITATGTRLPAVLARARIVYAKGVAIESGRSLQVLLAPKRTVGAGRYTLTIGAGKGRRHVAIAIG
jgi:hypothetical protein